MLDQRHKQATKHGGAYRHNGHQLRTPASYHEAHRFRDDHSRHRCQQDGEKSEQPGNQAAEVSKHPAVIKASG